MENRLTPRKYPWFLSEIQSRFFPQSGFSVKSGSGFSLSHFPGEIQSSFPSVLIPGEIRSGFSHLSIPENSCLGFSLLLFLAETSLRFSRSSFQAKSHLDFPPFLLPPLIPKLYLRPGRGEIQFYFGSEAGAVVRSIFCSVRFSAVSLLPKHFFLGFWQKFCVRIFSSGCINGEDSKLRQIPSSTLSCINNQWHRYAGRILWKCNTLQRRK